MSLPFNRNAVSTSITISARLIYTGSLGFFSMVFDGDLSDCCVVVSTDFASVVQLTLCGDDLDEKGVVLAGNHAPLLTGFGMAWLRIYTAE